MIKIGFIGCGKITDHHISCIKKVKGISTQAVCDLNYEKAKLYASKYNISAYTNYDQMLKNDSQIDLVCIMTPSGMHYENTIDILKKYKKHIIVEKPTFLKASQVKKAFQVAKYVAMNPTRSEVVAALRVAEKSCKKYLLSKEVVG